MRVDEISLSGPLTVILSVTPCVRQENGASQYCLWLARSRTLRRGNGSLAGQHPWELLLWHYEAILAQVFKMSWPGGPRKPAMTKAVLQTRFTAGLRCQRTPCLRYLVHRTLLRGPHKLAKYLGVPWMWAQWPGPFYQCPESPNVERTAGVKCGF